MNVRVRAVECASLCNKQDAFNFCHFGYFLGIEKVSDAPQCTYGDERNGDYGYYIVAHPNALAARSPKFLLTN